MLVNFLFILLVPIWDPLVRTRILSFFLISEWRDVVTIMDFELDFELTMYNSSWWNVEIMHLQNGFCLQLIVSRTDIGFFYRIYGYSYSYYLYAYLVAFYYVFRMFLWFLEREASFSRQSFCSVFLMIRFDLVVTVFTLTIFGGRTYLMEHIKYIYINVCVRVWMCLSVCLCVCVSGCVCRNSIWGFDCNNLTKWKPLRQTYSILRREIAVASPGMVN